MTHKIFGLGVVVAAVAIAAVFVTAQGTNDQGRAGGPPVVQQQAPPQGPVGQGRGRGQGLGPGPGQGLGPNQQPGPPAGRGGPMMGRGRGQGVGPRAGRPGGRGGFAALDLTDAQRTKINDVQRATRDQAAPTEDELEFTQKTLQRELFADKRDNTRIGTLTTKVAALQKQLADLHVKTMTAVADLLTPEQRETMRLREGRVGGAGRGAGAGPGPALRHGLGIGAGRVAGSGSGTR